MPGKYFRVSLLLKIIDKEVSAVKRNGYNFISLPTWLMCPSWWTRGFVFQIQASEVHRCSSNHHAKLEGSPEEPDDLEILARQITKVVHYYSSDGSRVESADGWKDKMMKKGWEDEWITTVKEGRVYNLSLNLSLMDGWKEEIGGSDDENRKIMGVSLPSCIL